MLSVKEVLAEKDRLVNMKNLVETYEEIAAIRMRKTRSQILHYRDFVQGLTQIFQDVKISYKSQILTLMKEKKIKDSDRLTLTKHNGKTVAALFSANTGLYGDLVKRTFNLFADYMKKNPQAEAVIVGRLGRFFFQEAFPNRPYQSFDLPDHVVKADQLQDLTKYLLQYEKILVFYGNFQSLSSQKSVVLKIADDDMDAQKDVAPIRYFSEPSLEKLMRFFEQEIFASIIEQTLNESDLAKFASRMFTLDKATENIKAKIVEVERQQRMIRHQTNNRKQQATLSGMFLWKKR
jgi:F0F1-type ATP synthase gamma subunit